MKKLFAAAAVLPFLSGVALAGQPQALSAAQMDEVTAGAAGGILVTLAASAAGSLNALADTALIASIVQTPVVIMDTFGSVTLNKGTAMVTFSSTSSN
ncbi:hypothetical protein GCM10011611_27510 [Aliidongia dinghuensis]|uniref:Secreted protein n=1 Tax=Aliidongia dinghuensis TaxID=1867774 RepID=A0A8J2YV25_9PROT|nr:hypothetical protein [Aliidongia dinghuensis]GGF20004.1 hypothetical protein GCM10011611_27510 [Aliidongia dinghuensis]